MEADHSVLTPLGFIIGNVCILCICVYVCLYIMYVCIHAHTSGMLYLHVCLYIMHVSVLRIHVCLFICLHACISVC